MDQLPRPRVFVESSMVFAGILSPTGGAGTILTLCETGDCQAVISEQVIDEVKRNLAEKAPEVLPRLDRILQAIAPEVVPYPSAEQTRACEEMIRHAEDAPILAAAMAAKVDYLVTLNRKHFIDDPDVSRTSSLRIGLPGQFLEWFRMRLETALLHGGS